MVKHAHICEAPTHGQLFPKGQSRAGLGPRRGVRWASVGDDCRDPARRLPGASRAWTFRGDRAFACEWEARRRGGPVASGDIWIVEIKSCLLDFQTDGKWTEYRSHCDRLYFAVSPDFPCHVIPNDAGLMLADRYGAHLVCGPVEERLSAARRKAMMLTFARAAALRLQLHLDPGCGFEI